MTSEAQAQQAIRLAAPNHGVALHRNNSGAATTADGRHIRFGLGNDSAQRNAVIKSSDLIGITKRLITLEDVGTVVGIFTSIEVKKPGWTYRGTDREQAQQAWLDHVVAYGGIGLFATGPEDVWE